MKATLRLPQAPERLLPELEQFLQPFHVHFQRSEARQAFGRYLSGLLTEHPRKNCDTIADIVPQTSEQSLQELLTNMVWDHDDLGRQRVQRLLTLATEGDGVLLFDDTGFVKKGNASVGVAYQYSGTLGKTGNCQVAVNCVYAERTLAWPVASRLYLPKQWAYDMPRRHKARVPEEIVFQTKSEIALDLLDQARSWGVRFACVVADCDYGDNPNFIKGLEQRDELYMVRVRCDFPVTLARRAAAPVQQAQQALASLPPAAWRPIRWRQGSAGWLQGRFAAVRCWWVDSAGVCRIGWLIGERRGKGEQQEEKYWWSNFGAAVPPERMVEYGHRQHWIEQYHEEAKELLGWAQYQGRLWPGFHRHAQCVMLAYSFLVWLEWHSRHRRGGPGRPRQAFSPSAGPASAVAAGVV